MILLPPAFDMQELPDAAPLAKLLEQTIATGTLAASSVRVAARYAGYDPHVAAQELAEDLLEQIM
jgi:hypothetical protein